MKDVDVSNVRQVGIVFQAWRVEYTREAGKCPKNAGIRTDLVNAAIVHLGYVLPHWRGKGVVGAAPAAVREELLVLVRVGEQRELGYPQEVASIGRERQVP